MKLSTTGSIIRLAVIAACLSVALPMTGIGDSLALASTNRVAPCQGDNLWGAFVATGAATGNFIYTIALINVGDTSCRLNGYPRIQGMRNGRTFSLRLSRHGTFAGNLSPTTLSPRMSGKLLLSVADNCNALNTGGIAKVEKLAAADTYSNFTIRLPGTGGDVYVSGFKVDIACGLEVSRLGWNAS
jgi:hypothetical protein